ncbi:Choline-sulfatase [Serinicoccus hydrothermalis]|uniref:Choline-sulfatase n=1 Tax=Serinicoccus hydrothermalis TaxID=1758689 RepID=A0A1B1N8R7_9MICO|nr:choline-sulfatase [Serinicoccus hydrothermalis]ANS77808.1 Choline-sulfatase [Serinicoccus hydrothermalis]
MRRTESGRRPNIVLIQADQLAPHHVGAYGAEAARTPHIDELARGAAVFDRAYCSTPLCAPSRASMLTGRLPSDLGCYDNGDDFAATEPTFAHLLRSAGYHTALVGRMHFIGPDQHHGFEQRLTTDVYPADLDMVPDWDHPLDRPLQWYHDVAPVLDAGASVATVQQDFDDEVVFSALRHLNDRARADQAAGERQPFLLVASFIHPHDPYEPPPEHWERLADADIPPPAHPEVPDAEADPHSHRLRQMCGLDRRPPSPDDVHQARRAYYAAVSYVDDMVGRIRARLEALGLADDTVVILTSDHGDMLGEKGLWFKMSPYEQSSRVPMIVHDPWGLVPQGRFANPVSLLDVLPTLLELGDVDPPPTAQGLSLLESARREQAGTPPTDRDVVVEYLAEGTHHPQVTVVRGPLKLVVCPGDPDQLFDLDSDPDELHDRVSDPELAEAAQSMRAQVESRYDLAALGESVRASQRRRTLVAEALSTGRRRPWDLVPEAEQRYVRGDFWGALGYGRVRSDARHGGASG